MKTLLTMAKASYPILNFIELEVSPVSFIISTYMSQHLLHIIM